MNNRYFATLLCITVLALAPACCKKSCTKTAKDVQENVNTMIELDNSVFETEEDNDANVVKF
jgi:hypothetical protein